MTAPAKPPERRDTAAPTPAQFTRDDVRQIVVALVAYSVGGGLLFALIVGMLQTFAP